MKSTGKVRNRCKEVLNKFKRRSVGKVRNKTKCTEKIEITKINHKTKHKSNEL